jgi:ceramide glucosyltransferase
MATTRQHLEAIGGFAAIADYLADDFKLGNLIVRQGAFAVLSPVPVACWASPMGWRDVWTHQLRWARTIRFCKPGPYAASLLGNATLWPILWLATAWNWAAWFGALSCVVIRMLSAHALQSRLAPSLTSWRYAWLAPVKDLLQFALWVGSWTNNRIEWRGERYRVHTGGKLTRD